MDTTFQSSEGISPEHAATLREVFTQLRKASDLIVSIAPETDLSSQELEHVRAIVESMVDSLRLRGMDPIRQGIAAGPTLKDLEQYQQAVTRTCATTEQEETLKLALIGLSDELGEVAGPIKKYLWHGHHLNRVHLLGEVGDVLWYLATLCNALEISLTDALHANLRKLSRRYPDGFSSERSLNRSV
jgi:NTP pyrophosphatase (non-canonical NTP hydrolase)